jgi:hypothetical protein
MTTRRSIKTTLVATVAALLVGGGSVLAVVPRAQAVTPDQAIAAAKKIAEVVKFAYQVYQFLNPKDEFTLEEATKQITDAIDSAKNDIVDQIGKIAASEVESCANSAVIDLADISRMSPQSKMDFASKTTKCVTDAQAKITGVESKSSINQIGFTLHVVGPIALLARAHAGYDTEALKQTLIAASKSLVDELAPRCSAYTQRDAEDVGRKPDATTEVLLKCTAFNGTEGTEVVPTNFFGPNRNRPYDYSIPRETAMRGTSYELTLQVLPMLNP